MDELTAEQRVEQFLFNRDKPEAPEQEAPETEATEAPEAPEAPETEETPSEEPVETTSEEQVETAEIELDGELYEVPAKLKDAVLRQQDYTKKTQELAEQRRAIQEQQAQLQKNAEVEAKFRQEKTELDTIYGQIQQYEAIDWQGLASENVSQYLALKEKRDQLQKTLDTRATALNQAIQQFVQEQQNTSQQKLAKAMDEIKQAIPNFNQETAQSLRSALQTYGFAEDEVSYTPFNHDARYIKLLHDAHQFRQLKKGLPITKKVTPQARTLRPGQPVKPQSPQANLKQSLRGLKSDSSKAKAIEGFLTRKFGG